MPSVTKWNVVPPCISIEARGWWVSTNTGRWYGGFGPHQPRQSRSHSPRTGPNILRPMMNAPAATMTSISARLSSGASNIQPCSAPSGTSPKGRSSVCRMPAPTLSSDSDMVAMTGDMGNLRG